MTRDELLAELLVERYVNPWWTTPGPDERLWDDSEMTTARRRRALVEHDDRKREVA